MKRIFKLFCIISLSSIGLLAKMHILTEASTLHLPIKSWIEIKNKHLVRQEKDYSCGSASLATILKHFYNKNISEKEILDTVMKIKGLNKKSSIEAYKKANGLSFLDLSKFAQTKEFNTLGLALDINALKKLKIPVILYIKIRENEHFTVFKGMDNTYVYLADPSFGNTKVRLSKFKEMFYQREDLKYPGKVLAILPLTDDIKTKKGFMRLPKNSNLIKNVIKSKNLK